MSSAWSSNQCKFCRLDEFSLLFLLLTQDARVVRMANFVTYTILAPIFGVFEVINFPSPQVKWT